MKSFFTFVVSSLICHSAFSQQINNGNFSSWTAGTPTGWTTGHSSLSASHDEVQDTTNTYLGSPSIKMTTGTLPAPANMPYPGFVHYGASAYDNSIQDFVLMGSALSYKPDTLEFAYKYTPSGSDSASVFMNLYKGNIGNIVGIINMQLAASATFKLVKIPVQYYSSLTPDSMNLTFYSGDMITPQIGSALNVTDVKLVYRSGAHTASVNQTELNNQILVYPNPSSTKINFNMGDNMVGGIIKIYNLMGSELITSEIGNNSESIDICPLAEGMYVYRIEDKSDKVIATGKFNKELLQ